MSPTRRRSSSRPADQLTALFAGRGVPLDADIVTSCGSGVTACALAFAAHLIGHDRVAVYDGSWSEWGFPDGPPIETGPARYPMRRIDDTVTYLDMFGRPPGGARVHRRPRARSR